ncbi:MAG: acyltransferase family protein [Reyranellales bacterium]
MTSQSVAPSRYHALDSLRAAMMFLGIYLHVVVAYSPRGGWPLKLPPLTSALDVTATLIHVFRMPVFYVMAGFFAALLYQRYGLRRAAENRFQRIVVPFVVGWLILFPLQIVLAGPVQYGWSRVWDGIVSGRVLAYVHPMHLWFLEYLVVLYLLAVVVGYAVVKLVPSGAQVLFMVVFRRAAASLWAPLLFTVPSFLALLPMKWPGLEDPPSFLPTARIVIAYAIPFAFGWLLFLNADLLDTLRRRAWVYTLLAAIPCALYPWLMGAPIDRDVAFYGARAAHSLALWLLIYGITGLFLRYFEGYNPLLRYLCDSSYFLYVASMPVIMSFQLLLMNTGWPPLLKIAVNLAGSVAVLLVMYRYAVRPTFIGEALNGRRYSLRSIPAVAAAS